MTQAHWRMARVWSSVSKKREASRSHRRGNGAAPRGPVGNNAKRPWFVRLGAVRPENRSPAA